ncbi:ABC transporter substrate-binding protein [Niallia circulans]|uniref:ABC transporter substrate-binding protein n=1 Tax=Niallia circulans TaxID=1397 RepID=UPI001F47CDB7|nr:ABC transporter substrate-binding protein [Niallia circulans]MCF2650135.1 ABC transporter substrate-binding protein [Niallia circulans]
MKKIISFKFISIVVIGILLLAACSSNSTSSSKSDDNSGEENPVTDRGNEIVIGVGTEPQNWDPIDTFRLDWSTVMTSVYEGLVTRTVDLEIQPGLATEWEYIDDNTLQFKLREGVVFHDGEPFNADAVKFTFDRLLGEEGAKGPQQANYTSIDHVEVVDDYTVNFIMKTKDPVIITKLAGYGAVIVPPKYIEEKGDEFFNNNPVGTGPFKLTEYESNNKVVLEKNPDYWQAELPKLDKVTFRIIPESATRLAELQTGKIDIMKKVEVSQAETVKDSSFLNLMEVGTPTANAIRFDLNEKPTDDVRVRQAINYAIDKQALIDEILSGYGKPIASFQSELSFGNNPDLEPYPYDPEKAKELLKEAGVAEGTELDFYISGTDATFKEIAQAVAFFLEQVGLKANINSVDSNTLGTELVPQGNAGHMWQQGWGGWTLDFDNTAYLMYHEGEYYNPTFKDDKVEELLTAERTTVDQEEREKIFMELTERVYELTPEIPLYSTVDLYAVNNRVKNFQPPHDDRMFLENVTVE